MNIYSICHDDTYLKQQIYAFKKFSKDCNFTIVLPGLHAKAIKDKFQKYNCNIVTSNSTWYIDIVNEVAISIKDDNVFSIIIEWDIVPIKEITDKRCCSYRGPQSRSVEKISIKSYYPNILGFNPKDTTYNNNFFKKNEKPFSEDFLEMQHRILLDSDVLEYGECAVRNNFSIVGNNWLHCLHGYNINQDRMNCWNNIVLNL
jgi:hypothetical protein